MQKTKNQLILTEEDYNLLNSYLNAGIHRSVVDRRNADMLQAELRKAKLVNKNEFPLDVVRLNSRVKVKTDQREEVMELTLVTPDRANIKEKKISVMAPIGTALIGFRQGQQVKWQVPSGKKTFTIMEVINEIQ
ncbi:nucleoside diphosphate kinase regulator [Flavitalea sp.]|nr:nucleoside diphosphate kinase regulator [Flavitalea sp.]